MTTMLARAFRQSPAAGGALSLLAIALTSPLADAQVPRLSPALELASFEDRGGEYLYRYRLNGRVDTGEMISDVYLTLYQPWTERVPVVTGTRGHFLFDALASRHDEVGIGHPDVFVGTPEKWSGAIYRQGMLSWGASRFGGGENHGIEAGEYLGGFELRSRALPGLRQFSAVPWRPLGADSPHDHDHEDEDEPVDSAWVLQQGVVVGPGWDADIVTSEFLRYQIDLGCRVYLVENCGRYLRHLDRVAGAESTGDNRAYRRALGGLQRYLHDDRVSHRDFRFVMDHAIVGLAARPPSERDD